MTNDLGRQLAALEKRISGLERASRLASASLDNTALEVRGPDGGLTGVLGVQPDGTTGLNVVNGAAPPAPSTPTVAPAIGGISITWDGTLAGGASIPLDWARVEVHVSTTDGFTPGPDTLMATIETPQGTTVYVASSAPSTDVAYVRLLARNTSGTASDPTVQVGPYAPRAVVDTDVADGSITETKIATDAVTTPKIKAGAVQTAELDALAVTTAKLAAGSVDATALKADAVTGKTITGGTITGSTIQTGTTGAHITVNASGDNSIKVYNSSGTQVTTVGGSSGAVQSISGFKSATLGDGGLTFTNSGAGNPGSSATMLSNNAGTVTVDSGYQGGGSADLATALTVVNGDSTLSTLPPRVTLLERTNTRSADFRLSGSVIKTDNTGTPYTWQNPVMASGWSAISLQYRLNATDDVRWIGRVDYTGTAVTAAGAATILNSSNLVPAAYRPTADRQVGVIHQTSTGVTKNVSAFATIRADGNLSIAWGDGMTGTTHDAQGLANGDRFLFYAPAPLGHIA